jgi:hypothetical protein
MLAALVAGFAIHVAAFRPAPDDSLRVRPLIVAAGDSAAGADTHAVHTTRGIVKSVGADAIVVARPKGRGDITFRLRSSLHRSGTIAVGSVVSVRYEDQGDVHVAIAVAVQRP